MKALIIVQINRPRAVRRARPPEFMFGVLRLHRVFNRRSEGPLDSRHTASQARSSSYHIRRLRSRQGSIAACFRRHQAPFAKPAASSAVGYDEESMIRRLLSKLKHSRLPAIPEMPGSAANPAFRIVETYLYDTCTHRCGYCWLAESGQVLDFKQLDRFRSPAWIDSVALFFNSRSTQSAKWLLQLTGGEPLIAPNLERLCQSLFEFGNRVAFYTALLVGHNHPGFRFLTSVPPPSVDYIMASFHPEAELGEARYFDKLTALKAAGHRVFLRYVGHPARLRRLEELAEKCDRLSICFLPTTLLSSSYPGAYRDEERRALMNHFTSLSQFIMLEGGIDTRTSRCYAGSKIVAANLQTGDITPCISVHRPIIGNIFRNELKLYADSIACPEAGINCSCDVHFQQNIVKGCYDNDNFQAQKGGFVAPRPELIESIHALRATPGFYVNPSQGIGRVQDESRLFYTIEEVRRNYRANHGSLNHSTD